MGYLLVTQSLTTIITFRCSTLLSLNYNNYLKDIFDNGESYYHYNSKSLESTTPGEITPKPATSEVSTKINIGS